MKKAFQLSIFLLVVLAPVWGWAQEPETGDFDLDETLVETAMDESGSANLILDNTRTKVGKDFYDLFYTYWTSQQTVADTSRKPLVSAAVPAGQVIITIEELPSPGSGNLILISIDDQPVWQQFVQARYDLLEVDAAQAVAELRTHEPPGVATLE